MPGKRVGGLAHFGEADSRQVSSVGGPASTSVTDLVQLPGASLGCCTFRLQQVLHAHAQKGVSMLLPTPRVTAVAWYLGKAPGGGRGLSYMWSVCT